MLIKYLFSVSDGDEVRHMNAMYDETLKKVYALEPEQRFYRASLQGNVSFLAEDYDWFDSKLVDTEFTLFIQVSYNNGRTWEVYWKGAFHKIDCEFDMDNKRVTLSNPRVIDDYKTLLENISVDYNLSKLPVARTLVDITKRPVVQFYILGEDYVTNFVGGVAWDTQVTPESNSGILTGWGFNTAQGINMINVYGTGTPAECTGLYSGLTTSYYAAKNETYRIERRGSSPNYYYDIIRDSDTTTMFTAGPYASTIAALGSVSFSAVGGGASGTLTGSHISPVLIYSRMLTDAASVNSNATSAVSSTDFCSLGYEKVVNYPAGGDSFGTVINIGHGISSSPTPYGTNYFGEYYEYMDGLPDIAYYPVLRNNWAATYSLWADFTGTTQEIYESDGRYGYTLRDGMKIEDIIETLLDEIDPTILHRGSSAYSHFLYSGTNPISGDSFRVMLTQKSNITAGEYERPAQKIPTTLKQILDMLRNTFQCYWCLDSGKLVIEHVSWFQNGGSYDTPTYSTDLTAATDPRNGKSWDSGQNIFSFDASDTPIQLEFSWMDDVSEIFEGSPIKILSNFSKQGNIKKVIAGDVTSDVDFMLANSLNINPDGFALLCPILGTSGYELPFVELDLNGLTHETQNGYASWIYLHEEFWRYDLPSAEVNINGTDMLVLEPSKIVKQSVKFPTSWDLDPMKLIRTGVGDGQIEKLSISLSSRENEVDLKFKPSRT